MPIRYKFNVLEALRDAGYNSSRLRKDKILGQRTIQSLREGKPVSFEVLSTLCALLHCQPGDMLECVEDNDTQQAE